MAEAWAVEALSGAGTDAAGCSDVAGSAGANPGCAVGATGFGKLDSVFGKAIDGFITSARIR